MTSAENREAAQKRVGAVVGGKYELLRVLGVGGMGAVYEAQHSFTARRVAVKLIHEKFLKVGTVAKRFLQEARATSGLDHPSIIEVLDAGQEADGKLYLVFEMLHGGSMRQALREGSLTVLDLIRISIYLFDALAVAHAAQMVHRDIKPENIFLCDDKEYPERVKLLDFGVARKVTGQTGDGLTKVGAVLGTPYFMSPEVLMGQPVDTSADLWAMGVVMYRALSGVMPFVAGSPDALLKQMLTKGRKPLAEIAPSLPKELTEIVERLLATSADDRFSSAEQVAVALRTFAPDATKPAAAAPVVRNPSVAVRRSSGPWVPEQDSNEPTWRDELESIRSQTLSLLGHDHDGDLPTVQEGHDDGQIALPPWLQA